MNFSWWIRVLQFCPKIITYTCFLHSFTDAVIIIIMWYLCDMLFVLQCMCCCLEKRFSNLQIKAKRLEEYNITAKWHKISGQMSFTSLYLFLYLNFGIVSLYLKYETLELRVCMSLWYKKDYRSFEIAILFLE